MVRIGLLINPYAGIGGPMALKGSDGVPVDQLLAEGGQCLANQRAAVTLMRLKDYEPNIQWLSAPGVMGAEVLSDCGFNTKVVGHLDSEQTCADDTERLAVELLDEGVDVLVFVGGDGTARNMVNALQVSTQLHQLVLGIPAGVKMHSGVYTVSPQAATPILESLIKGEPVTTAVEQVRDIDEQALRQGQLNSRYYGELLVPNDERYVQQVKNTARANEEAIQLEIAAGIVDDMDNETLYIIGCGTTPKAVMDELGLANTLLGIDVVLGRQLIAEDVNAPELTALLAQYPHHPAELLITAIGGQGHIIGRGNQQLSPTVLNRIGKANTKVLVTPLKLAEFNPRPLLIDSGDMQLDQQWQGFITVYTGYQQTAVYPLK